MAENVINSIKINSKDYDLTNWNPELIKEFVEDVPGAKDVNAVYQEYLKQVEAEP